MHSKRILLIYRWLLNRNTPCNKQTILCFEMSRLKTDSFSLHWRTEFKSRMFLCFIRKWFIIEGMECPSIYPTKTRSIKTLFLGKCIIYTCGCISWVIISKTTKAKLVLWVKPIRTNLTFIQNHPCTIWPQLWGLTWLN